MHLFGNAPICASTVLECSSCRIHRNVAAARGHRGRDEVHCNFLRDGNYSEGDGRAPPTLTSRGYFSIMMECTSESGHCDKRQIRGESKETIERQRDMNMGNKEKKSGGHAEILCGSQRGGYERDDMGRGYRVSQRKEIEGR